VNDQHPFGFRTELFEWVVGPLGGEIRPAFAEIGALVLPSCAWVCIGRGRSVPVRYSDPADIPPYPTGAFAVVPLPAGVDVGSDASVPGVAVGSGVGLRKGVVVVVQRRAVEKEEDRVGGGNVVIGGRDAEEDAPGPWVSKRPVAVAAVVGTDASGRNLVEAAAKRMPIDGRLRESVASQL